MKNLIKLLLLFSLSPTACVSHLKPISEPLTSAKVLEPIPTNCLDRKSKDDILNRLAGIVDKMSSEKTGDNVLILDGCFKNVYRRKDYKIILYKDPQAADHSTVASVMKKSVDAEKYTPACLAKAESDIAALNLRFADQILKRGRTDIAWRWTDMDMGSVFWLSCEQGNSILYNESLDTLLHETTHYLKHNDCIFSPYAAEHLCLTLPSSLPPRSIAAYKQFTFKNPAETASFQDFESVYMETMNEGPLLLFDELNAYSVTAGVLAGLLQRHGKAALVDSEDRRSAVLVTALMAYTVRYLQFVHDRHPMLAAI